jgi:hypothetical protein
MRTLPIFALATLLSSSAVALGTGRMSCSFTTFINVLHDNPEKAHQSILQQRMRIIDGTTDEATLKLDGKLRATNSRTWQLLKMQNWKTWQSSFVGDFGDVLTIAHELGANERRLNGVYKATLVSTNLTGIGVTQIMLGECAIE